MTRDPPSIQSTENVISSLAGLDNMESEADGVWTPQHHDTSVHPQLLFRIVKLIAMLLLRVIQMATDSVIDPVFLRQALIVDNLRVLRPLSNGWQTVLRSTSPPIQFKQGSRLLRFMLTEGIPSRGHPHVHPTR